MKDGQKAGWKDRQIHEGQKNARSGGMRARRIGERRDRGTEGLDGLLGQRGRTGFSISRMVTQFISPSTHLLSMCRRTVLSSPF